MPDTILEGAGMPVRIDGHTYYHTVEVCRMVGISRNTLFRWVKTGVTKQPAGRDRRGWRLFTLNQIEEIKAEANRTT
jgi:predicted site-specific integrase-resolvase